MLVLHNFQILKVLNSKTHNFVLKNFRVLEKVIPSNTSNKHSPNIPNPVEKVIKKYQKHSSFSFIKIFYFQQVVFTHRIQYLFFIIFEILSLVKSLIFTAVEI